MLSLILNLLDMLLNSFRAPARTEERGWDYPVIVPRGSLANPKNLEAVHKEIAYAIFLGFEHVTVDLRMVTHLDFYGLSELKRAKGRAAELEARVEIKGGDQIRLIMVAHLAVL